MATRIIDPYTLLRDLDGTPLENGFVFIGEVGLEPEANPAEVFWDVGLTIPAVQPIRTIAGRLSDLGGQIGNVYLAGYYSITIKNSDSVTVYSDQNAVDTTGEVALARAWAEGTLPGGAGTFSAREYAQQVLESVSYLSFFGAVGDTVIDSAGVVTSGTDDTLALQAAINWCLLGKGRKIIADPGAVYKISATLTGVGSILLDLTGGRIIQTVDAPIFDFSAPLFGPFELAADYVSGSAINLTGDQLPVAPLAGQVMKIVADADDPANRDQGTSTQRYHCGEFFTVGEGSTITSIAVSGSLQFTRGIDPVLSPGPQPDVACYTPAYNARIVYADMSALCEITGGTVGFESGHDADIWTADSAILRGYYKSVLRLGFLETYGANIKTYGTLMVITEGCSFLRAENDTPNGQLGYNVGDVGYCTQVSNMDASWSRHAYTTAEPTFAAAETDPKRLIGIGRVQGATISHSIARGGDGAHWSTHAGGQNVSFSHCTSYGGSEHSISLRGRETSATGMRAVGTQKGFLAFTDFANGDGGSYTRGKTNRDITNAYLDSLNFDVVQDPITVTHSIVEIAGNNEWRSTDHQFALVTGGTLRLKGNHSFSVTGDGAGGSDTDGIIQIIETNAALLGAVPIPRIIIEGNVTIDARAATSADVACIELALGTELIVRGKLILRVPGAYLYQRGSGTVIIEDDGYIEVEQAGVQTVQLYAPRKGISAAIDLESTDTTVSDGGLISRITTTTNDDEVKKTAVQMAVRGDGTTGYGKLEMSTSNASSGGLVPRTEVRSNGNVNWLKLDGSTVGAQWNPTADEFYVAGNAVGKIVAQMDQSTDLTLNVPTDGTFAQVLDKASLYRTNYGATVTVMIETGHKPVGGVVLANRDMTGIIISSIDATVFPAIATATTSTFLKMTNCHGLVWNLLIDSRNGATKLGACGVAMYDSHMEVIHRCGYTNVGDGTSADGVKGTNFFVYGTSRLFCNSVTITGTRLGLIADGASRKGVWVTYGSVADVVAMSAQDCGTEDGDFAIFASRGAIVHADSSTFTGSWGGIRAARCYVCAREIVADSVTGRVAWAFEGATITMSLSTASGSGSATQPVLMAGNDATTSGQGLGFIIADRSTFDSSVGPIVGTYGAGSIVDIQSATGTGIIRGIGTVKGGTVHANFSDFATSATSTTTHALQVGSGSTFNFRGGTWDGASVVDHFIRAFEAGSADLTSATLANNSAAQNFIEVEDDGHVITRSLTRDDGFEAPHNFVEATNRYNLTNLDDLADLRWGMFNNTSTSNRPAGLPAGAVRWAGVSMMALDDIGGQLTLKLSTGGLYARVANNAAFGAWKHWGPGVAEASTPATGTFTTVDSKTVTVENGLIVSIV